MWKTIHWHVYEKDTSLFVTYHFSSSCLYSRAGIVQSVQRLATGWTVRGSNPGGGEIIRTRSDRPRGRPSLLYTGDRSSFPGVKLPGSGVDQPPHLERRLKEE